MKQRRILRLANEVIPAAGFACMLLLCWLIPEKLLARTLVVADLHGDGDILQDILSEQSTGGTSPLGPWSPGKDKLVLTGDFFDRYSRTVPLLSTIDHFAAEHPQHIEIIAGNHDVFTLAGLCGTNDQDLKNWLGIVHDHELGLHQDNGAVRAIIRC